MSGHIQAPLTGFKPGSYTLTQTTIPGGTKTEVKGLMNDALGQVVIFDVAVTTIGSQVTMTAKITVDQAKPVKAVAQFNGSFAGTIQAKDAQGRTPIKSATRNITYLITPKTIPGIGSGTTESQMNAMLKAKGLM